MRRHAAPRRAARAHVAMRLPPQLLASLLIRPGRARGRRRCASARRRRHLTSPIPPRFAFFDPAAASPLLRLPALPSMSRLGWFLSPPPSPSSLAPCLLPTSPGIWPRTYLSPARPLAFPVASFFILRAGLRVGRSLFLDQGKRRGKKKRAFFLRPAVSLSLAGSLKRLIRACVVCGQAIAELESIFLGVPGHFEVRSFVEL